MLTESFDVQAQQELSGSVFNMRVASVTSSRPWSALSLGLLTRVHSAAGSCKNIPDSRCPAEESIDRTKTLLSVAQTALQIERAMRQQVQSSPNNMSKIDDLQ